MVRFCSLFFLLLASVMPEKVVPRRAEAEDRLPRVPAGFTIERVTTPELVRFPMMAGFDEKGRLFVACSAGKNLRAGDLMKDPPNFIKLLEDTNGDGVFDKATVFADKMTLPMGALWYRGALYVASPPHIWKLEDTDGDGVADKRTILVDKFGFNGNAASVHGCFLGPEGRIYWCDGRHGHEFRDKQGNIVSKGKAARIFSCKPDGSDVRVHCGGGMDNPVEIDFTATGEMIGSVNILLGRPRVDCLVHWVEGGVYPRYDQQDCIAEFPRTGDLLPPITRFGHVAVSGMMRYRSDQFGPEYRNNIFTTQFNTHKVVRSVLKRSGATFTTTEYDFLTSDDPDFHPTDVLEDADGSLLVIDTGGWFRIGCPVSKIAKPHIFGAIYRIRKTGAHQVHDPYGLQLDFGKMPARQAVNYLADPRPAVREKAIERLALLAEKAIPALQVFLRKGSEVPEQGRLNAVWALARMNSSAADEVLRRRAADESPAVRIAAASALIGRLNDLTVAQRLLGDENPALRREAARALGRSFARERSPRAQSLPPAARSEAVQHLFRLFDKPLRDRVLEHTVIYALIQIADRDATLPFLKHNNPAVRRAALIALDQMQGGNLTRDLVVPLLDTDDPALQKTSLDIIARHDGWAKETLSLLQKWLREPKLDDNRTAVIRGFLVAQAADKNVQNLIAEALLKSQNNPQRQLLLLEVIQQSSVRPFPAVWHSPLQEVLGSKQPAVVLQAVRIAGERQLPFDEMLRAFVNNMALPAELRAEALIAVAGRMKQIKTGVLRFLTGELKHDHPPLTKLTIARALAVAPWNEVQLVELTKTLAVAGPLEAPVVLRAFAKSKAPAVGLALVKALNGSRVLRTLPAEELNRVLHNYPAVVHKAARPLLKKLGVNPADRQRRIKELLKLADGGDAERGRSVFYSKKAACAGCHTIAGKGGRVGPDLSEIGRIRTPRDLVEAIAFPSASFARGFRSYVIVTEAGRIHTGVISRETAREIVLRTASLAEIRIPRNEIDVMRESSTSIMPKGLDKTLSPQELRDLLAFLRSQKETAVRQTSVR